MPQDVNQGNQGCGLLYSSNHPIPASTVSHTTFQVFCDSSNRRVSERHSPYGVLGCPRPERGHEGPRPTGPSGLRRGLCPLAAATEHPTARCDRPCAFIVLPRLVLLGALLLSYLGLVSVCSGGQSCDFGTASKLFRFGVSSALASSARESF